MVNRQDTDSGIGFLGLLTIVFIVLKLTGYITWPWWLVLAPLWAPLSVFVLVVVLTLAWVSIKRRK